MTDPAPTGALPALADEARRYLAAVEAFRAEGAMPTWAPEQSPPGWWVREHLPRRDESPRLAA